MAALSRSLEYGRLKSKAVSARNYRVAFRSQSGLAFQANQSFTIELAQLQRSYLDLNCMYLQFEIEHASGASVGMLDYSAYSIFNRITVSSAAGAVLEDTNYLNVYNAMLLQSMVSEEYQKGYGKTIGHAGRPGTAFGIDIPAAGSKTTICLPMLTGLATASRQLPLDVAAPLRFTFYIDDFKKFLVRKVENTALSDIKITNPRLIANITELSESTQVLLDQSLSQMSYNLNYSGIVSTQATRTATGAGTYVANLAFRNSSMNKIALIIQSQGRNSTTGQKNEMNHSISNRSTGGVQEISYFINGQRFPQNKMDVTHGFSEIWSENVLADRVLMDPTHHSSLNFSSVQANPGTGANAAQTLRNSIPENNRNFECIKGEHTNTPTNVDHYLGNDGTGGNKYGTFFSQLSLETFKSNMDGESIFSGVNCLGSTLQCELVFSGDNDFALDLYWFATVDKILSLDPVTRSWIVSD